MDRFRICFSEEECWIGLLVDGVFEKRICLKEGKHYYSLMEENKTQKRRICLMKLTEVQYASCALEALETEEGALCIPVSEKGKESYFLEILSLADLAWREMLRLRFHKG